MRIIVSGDMSFDDYKFLKRKLDTLTLKLVKVEVAITGRKGTYLGKSLNRTGAEYHAANWASHWKWCYFVYHTDHNFGKKDDPEARLDQMFEESDSAVFFWNGTNKDTKELIRKANKALGKDKVRVIAYKE